MPSFIEVTRSSETVIIDPASIVAIQHRGESHFIHSVGRSIIVSRDLAIELAGIWKKLPSEPAKSSGLFAASNKGFTRKAQ
jgi:hypothetical protein